MSYIGNFINILVFTFNIQYFKMTTVQMEVDKMFECFRKKSLMLSKSRFIGSVNSEILLLLLLVFCCNIFSNVIYLLLNFQHHYFSLQCHMIFEKIFEYDDLVVRNISSYQCRKQLCYFGNRDTDFSSVVFDYMNVLKNVVLNASLVATWCQKPNSIFIWI